MSAPSPRRSVLVVDDHAVVRQGLIRLLAESEPLLEVAEAGTARRALDLVRGGAFAAVILDISLPDENGLETLKAIKRIAPQTPVLVLSVHAEEQYAIRALKAGAAGYITKDKAPAELRRALDLAFRGRRYVSAATAERLAATLGTDADRPAHEALSDRELEVLRLLARGQTVGQIAAALFLSPKTVSTYRVRLLDKLGLASTAGLIRYAIENGLVD